MKQQSRATKGANNPDSPFDLLILDYRMPRKNGLEVAEQVLLQVPNQRIILASAYSHEIINSKGSARSVEILNKPFEFDAFIEMVERGDGNIVGGNKTKQPAKANSIAPNSQVTLKKTSDIGHWRQG
jgi:CheY-like chemotaxis protein